LFQCLYTWYTLRVFYLMHKGYSIVFEMSCYLNISKHLITHNYFLDEQRVYYCIVFVMSRYLQYILKHLITHDYFLDEQRIYYCIVFVMSSYLQYISKHLITYDYDLVVYMYNWRVFYLNTKDVLLCLRWAVIFSMFQSIYCLLFKW
jgi:hypothetical protein